MTDNSYSSKPIAMLLSGKSLARGAVEQRGLMAAALVAFFGVAVLGPKLTRMTTPRTRAQKLKDEAAYQAERLRRGAKKSGAKARKQARRLGGGRVERYL